DRTDRPRGKPGGAPALGDAQPHSGGPHHTAWNADVLDKPTLIHRPRPELRNGGVDIRRAEPRSDGEVRHNGRSLAVIIDPPWLRYFVAGICLAAQAEHVIVTEDVRDASGVFHQRPQCSATTESFGNVVDVAAGDAKVGVRSPMVGPAIRR